MPLPGQSKRDEGSNPKEPQAWLARDFDGMDKSIATEATHRNMPHSFAKIRGHSSSFVLKIHNPNDRECGGMARSVTAFFQGIQVP